MAARGVRRLRSGARPVRAAGEGCGGSAVGAVMRETCSLPKGRDPQGSGLRGPMRWHSGRVPVILTQERDPGRTPTKARKRTRAPRGDQPTPASPCSISCDRLPGRRRKFRVRAGRFGRVRPRLPHVRRPDRPDIAPALPLSVGCRQRSKRCSPSQIGSPSPRSWPVRTEAGSCSGRSIAPMHFGSMRLAMSPQ